MGFTKEQLLGLAQAGAAQRLAAIEAELANYHKEWPQLFLSATPPQLLKLPLKNGTNGHAPKTSAPTTTLDEQIATRVKRSNRYMTAEQMDEVRTLARAFLATHDRVRAQELKAYLAEQGRPVSLSTVGKILNAVGTLHGFGRESWWSPKAQPVGRPAKPAPVRRKRKLSAASRKKLAEAMRRRHASGEIARAKKAKQAQA